MSTIKTGTTLTTAYQVVGDTTGSFVVQTGSTPTTAMTIDTSQNVGIGVTPSSWTAFKALEIGGNGAGIAGGAGQPVMFCNGAYNSGWKYTVTGAASYYDQLAGAHRWFYAPSGTAGAAITFAESMRIAANGYVGISTNAPGVLLDLSGASLSNTNVTTPTTFALRANLQQSFKSNGVVIDNLNNARSLSVRNYYNSTSTNYPSTYGIVHAFEHYGGGEIGVGSQYIMQMAVAHSNTPVVLYRNSDTGAGTVFSNWYSVNMTNLSDERVKKNIVAAPDQLPILTQLEVKNFEYTNESESGVHLGMIAQQVDAVEPYYVTKDLENPDLMWRVHYDKMVPMLVKAIQELNTKVNAQAAEIAALKGQ